MIQPAFHRSILDRFICTFTDSSNSLLLKLKNAQEEINITYFINSCVLDILNGTEISLNYVKIYLLQFLFVESVLGVPISQGTNFNVDDSPFRQGKVMMSFRLSRPWLLFDWIYSMTATATAELQQKKNLSAFTRKVNN